MVKIEKHGHFFRKKRVRTTCSCGCVYLIPKKDVKKDREYNYSTGEYDVRFHTICPECMAINLVWGRGLVEKEEQDAR